jgi:hypothetical protein
MTLPSANTSTDSTNDPEARVEAHVKPNFVVGSPLVVFGPPLEPDSCIEVSSRQQ